MFQKETTRILHNTLAKINPLNPATVPVNKQPTRNGFQRSRNSVNSQLKVSSNSNGPRFDPVKNVPTLYAKKNNGGMVIGLVTQTNAIEIGKLHLKIIAKPAAINIWKGIGKNAQNNPIAHAPATERRRICHKFWS